MLRQRVNAYDDVRAPLFKTLADVADAAFMKKLARLGPELVHGPIQVLHPALLMPQNPVVNVYKFVGDVMRLFDGFYHANRDRFTMPKTLDADRKSLRGR